MSYHFDSVDTVAAAHLMALAPRKPTDAMRLMVPTTTVRVTCQVCGLDKGFCVEWDFALDTLEAEMRAKLEVVEHLRSENWTWDGKRWTCSNTPCWVALKL